MNMNREQQFKRELTEELRNNILPFWARQMVDPGGGFFGRMTGTGELIANAGRSAILCGRILWTFSAAYRTSGCEQYLATATAARDYLLDKFLDKPTAASTGRWTLRATLQTRKNNFTPSGSPSTD